ncbi:uncharacterized protein F5891DRAFT_993555 [Suillus fuscotomentosus]|uniref:Uncharacterized protein n=1 Tax=Suillus fuscotomentosus TaxID=1912939 RepID=A0AAD4HSJ7_9AGAM|nr:uncharacterized protein F5891DRAFT_993555 [Suillus fuscotomentosus]KAG1908535.1 hypothetical protein F5891DRAFT_993555 [Suillus fuscotomentosus]
MWCTRWFLPLLLLPLPTAQPYFLVLFLFSLALHAKPCFYCIVLLGALFLSSCYWQSFPLETRLSIPWSSTITTFYDALNVTLPPNFDLREHTPPIIRVNDRCWCDFTSGVFESYDMQKWERESVERLAADMVQQMKDRAEKLTAEEELPNAEEETSSPEETHLSAIHHTVHVISTQKSTLSALRSMFGQTEAQASPSIADMEPSTTTIPTPTTTSVSSSKPSLMSSPLPPRRPLEYDLNPYGFDLILDFHWS